MPNPGTSAISRRPAGQCGPRTVCCPAMIRGSAKSKLLALLILGATAGLGQNVETPEKPLTRRQVDDLVTAGVDSARITEMVDKRGVDFLPTEDFLGALRSKGAKEPLIIALKTSMPAALSKAELLRMLGKGEKSRLIENEVEQRGISFEPTEDDLDTIRIAGAQEGLLEALRKASRYTPPIATHTPSPPYTDEAHRAKLRGTLVLKLVVDAQGNVTDVIEISKPLGEGLDESAMKTVRSWKFKPATLNGTPVSVRIAVEFSFSM
jgi:TonB family protein